MFLNVLLIIIIGLCVIALGYIVLRKIPKLRTLDVETVPEAQKAKVRDRILKERIKRSGEKGKKIMQKGASPVGAAIKKFFQGFLKKVYALEKKYRKEAEQGTPLHGTELKDKVRKLLEEAETLEKEEKVNEAEKVYIEIVSIDSKNIEAYKGLTDIYIELKEYGQALQTAQLVLKLETKKSKPVVKKDNMGQKQKTVSNASEMANAYIQLGFVYRKMEKFEVAAQNFEKALELEPNNPRNLAKMIEVYLEMKKKSQALGMLKRLEEVNPDNQKLKEYKDKITEL